MLALHVAARNLCMPDAGMDDRGLGGSVVVTCNLESWQRLHT